MAESIWTDERVELLKKLHADGLSASVIARHLRSLISRNAVIGKLHRLGLCGRRDPKPRGKSGLTQTKRQVWKSRTGSRAERIAKPDPNWVVAPLPPPAADDIARVTFAQLDDHHCRFIPGEPSGGYCGLEKVPGTSYCPGHLHRCTGAPAPAPGRWHVQISSITKVPVRMDRVLEDVA